MFDGFVKSFTTTAKTAYTLAVLPQRETGPLRSHDIKATSCELQTPSSERLDEPKLAKSARTRTTLERAPGGTKHEKIHSDCMAARLREYVATHPNDSDAHIFNEHMKAQALLRLIARNPCGLLQDILLLLPAALFTSTGVSHGETASCETRRFVSSLQC
jgi:hypothetical protein